MKNSEKIEAVKKIIDKDEVDEADFGILLSFLKTKDWELKCLIAEALFRFVNTASKNILLEFLKDKSNLVRIEAIESLEVFAFEDVFTSVKNLAKSDTNFLVRGYAITCLAYVSNLLEKNPKETIDYVLSCIANERRNFVKINGYFALYILGEVGFLDQILQFLNDNNYHTRCSSVNILWEILDSNYDEKIITALKNRLGKEEVRAVYTTIQSVLEEHRSC